MMRDKLIKILLLLISIIFVKLYVPGEISAQSCGGSGYYCSIEQTICPSGCTNQQCNDGASGCDWQPECDTGAQFSCSSLFSDSSCSSPTCNPIVYTCGLVANNCTWNPGGGGTPFPTSPPGSSPTPTRPPDIGACDGYGQECPAGSSGRTPPCIGYAVSCVDDADYSTGKVCYSCECDPNCDNQDDTFFGGEVRDEDGNLWVEDSVAAACGGGPSGIDVACVNSSGDPQGRCEPDFGEGLWNGLDYGGGWLCPQRVFYGSGAQQENVRIQINNVRTNGFVGCDWILETTNGGPYITGGRIMLGPGEDYCRTPQLNVAGTSPGQRRWIEFTLLEPQLSCTVTLPPPPTMDAYQNSPGYSYSASATSTDETNYPVDQIMYYTEPLAPGDNVYFDPEPVTVSGGSFFTNIKTGAPGGSETIYALGRITSADPDVLCPLASVAVDPVNNTPAWWQVYGGSMWANKPTAGTISSAIPLSSQVGYSATLIEDLIIGGATRVSKGVAVTTGSSISPSTDIRTARGVAEFDDSVLNIQYFKDKLGITATTSENASNIGSGCTEYQSTGYEVCYARNFFTIGIDINLGDRKVILLVENTLTINNRVNVNDGVGFFMAIANDIIIPPALSGSTVAYPPDYLQQPSLEGLFLALDDVEIQGNPLSDQDQLRIRGSVVGLDHDGGINHGVEIGRSMPDNTVGPATVFEYAPDLILRYPRFLTPRSVIWREAAP